MGTTPDESDDDNVEKWSAARREETKGKKKKKRLRSNPTTENLTLFRHQFLPNPVAETLLPYTNSPICVGNSSRRLVGNRFITFFSGKFIFFQIHCPSTERVTIATTATKTTNAVCASSTKMANVQTYAIKIRSSRVDCLSLST